MEYETNSHCKYLIALHLILVVKYQKQLLIGDVGQLIKDRIVEIANSSDVWVRFPDLKRHFWKEKTFWSDGYLACSVGDASEETIKKYIQEQG